MTRMNTIRNLSATRDCVAWGKNLKNTIRNFNASPLIFAAALVICSIAVGCSSDKPKLVSSATPIPAPQTPVEMTPAVAPAPQPAAKPATKKVVRKKPATVNYADKTYGVTFEYPRRYAIETGDAASELLVSSPMPMNFVQPGGVALAAVELPETGFANTDFSSAFFDVSVHKGLSADQCTEFAVPAPKNVAASSNDNASTTSAQNASAETTQNASSQTTGSQTTGTQTTETTQSTASQNAASQPTTTDAASTETAKPSASDTTAAQSSAAVTTATPATPAPQSQTEPQGSKLMLGDLELRGTEAVTGEGTRQSDSKYFHVYQNGACYEFAMNVTTVASDQGITKHVDRDKVFSRLESILSTVKIASVAPEATADAPKTAATPVTAPSPAQ